MHDDEPIGNRDTMAWLDVSDRDPDEEVAPGAEISVADWVEFLSRPPTQLGARYESGVQYGTGGAAGRPLRLFLYSREDPSERAPGIVFVHGGGWQGYHPLLHIRHANHFAALGYVTATISYRLWPEVQWASMLEDVKCAIRWMRANAERIGLDPGRIAAAGGSAGGQLSAMAAVAPGRFEGSGGNAGQSSAIQAAVLWYPMTDMRAPGALPHVAGEIAEIIGSSAQSDILDASPLAHVSAQCPPILTMTGALDQLTPVAMIRDFHGALDAADVTNELHVFSDEDHGFDLYPAGWTRCVELMTKFLEKHLGA